MKNIFLIPLLLLAPLVSYSASGKVTSVTEATYDNEVLLFDDLPVLMIFSAPWCPTCKALDLNLPELAEQFAGKLKIVRIDTTYSPNLSNQFRINGIPDLFLMKRGHAVNHEIGLYKKEDVIRFIEKNY